MGGSMCAGRGSSPFERFQGLELVGTALACDEPVELPPRYMPDSIDLCPSETSVVKSYFHPARGKTARP
jgi:hypothetical protein